MKKLISNFEEQLKMKLMIGMKIVINFPLIAFINFISKND